MSKTVNFNIFAFLTLLIATIAAYMGKFEAGSTMYVIAVVVTSLASQMITFFTPSGKFVGASENWSVGKWITRAGVALLAVFTAVSGYGIATAAIALITPFIEIIIRVYGSATETQSAVARRKGI